MIQAAWRVDNFHLDRRTKLPEGMYRFAATVRDDSRSELTYLTRLGFKSKEPEVSSKALVRRGIETFGAVQEIEERPMGLSAHRSPLTGAVNQLCYRVASAAGLESCWPGRCAHVSGQ